MKDFQLRNDTKLLFRNDPAADLTRLTGNKKVLFVYGSGSIKDSGCYGDVSCAVKNSGGIIYELPNASREMALIEKGIALAQDKSVDMVIGAGGASVMDCAKLIAFGCFHKTELWDYIKGRKTPYGLNKLPLILMPTYPSSGSEYGLGAVAADARTGDFGTAYGIGADYAVLVPKYSLSLDREMTAYSGLVTLIQLSAAVLGDKNAVSYDIGVSVMRNVLKAAEILQSSPQDLTARGTIMYGAALSTSSRLGLGKEEQYAYDIYEVEFIPEVLFKVPYRKSLTVIFPRFLRQMSKYHEDDIRRYLADVYGFNGELEKSLDSLTALFEKLGINMYFDGVLSKRACAEVETNSILTSQEIFTLISKCMR